MHLEHLGVVKSGEHNAHAEIVGDRLVLVGGGGVEIWDIATRALVQRIRGCIPGDVEEDEEEFPGQGEPHGTGNLRVAADGRTAISWGGLRNVTVWRLDAGSRGARFFHAKTVTDAVLVRDGAAVLSSAHQTNELVLWDASTGAPLHRCEHPPVDGHSCGGALALHPDGRRLVSAGNGICAWDLDGTWLGMMSPETSFTVAISPVGRVYAIIEGRGGRALHVWRDVAGEKVGDTLVHTPDMPVHDLWPGTATVMLKTQTSADLHDLDGGKLSTFAPSSGGWLPLPDGEHIVVQSNFAIKPPTLIISRLRDGQKAAELEAAGRYVRAVGAGGLVIEVKDYDVHFYRV